MIDLILFIYTLNYLYIYLYVTLNPMMTDNSIISLSSPYMVIIIVTDLLNFINFVGIMFVLMISLFHRGRGGNLFYIRWPFGLKSVIGV